MLRDTRLVAIVGGGGVVDWNVVRIWVIRVDRYDVVVVWVVVEVGVGVVGGGVGIGVVVACVVEKNVVNKVVVVVGVVVVVVVVVEVVVEAVVGIVMVVVWIGVVNGWVVIWAVVACAVVVSRAIVVNDVLSMTVVRPLELVVKIVDVKNSLCRGVVKNSVVVSKITLYMF